MPKLILPTLLIIDDEADLRTTTKMVLEKDFDVSEADSGESGIQLVAGKNIDCVICDIRMSGLDGLQTLERLKHIAPQTEVIMQTAVADTASAVKAIKLGAYDYLIKPAEPEQLLNICLRAVEKKQLLNKTKVLEAQLEQHKVGRMMGKSKAMQEVFKKIKKVADSDVAVLITGETGTGKELVAQAIHYEGKRKDQPFIAINCGGIPSELLETELFGHEKGSFTSAENRKIGKFELAEGGTIFLDEIGNMPKLMQAKMLRVLQEKEIERVGGTAPIPVNVRIISATNENLKKSVQDGQFREDLLHRLNVIPLELPPLRERDEDIQMLCEFFLTKYNKLYNGSFKSIGQDTMEFLINYAWPGNIREMEHLIQRIVTLEDGPEVLPKHLTLEILSVKSAKRGKYKDGSLTEIISKYERDVIARAMDANNQNIQKVADKLDIHRSTLTSKLQSYGLLPDKKK